MSDITAVSKQVEKGLFFFLSLFLFIPMSDHSKNIQNTGHILIQL